MSSAGDGFLFTSESVTEGHPDKVADQISDAIVDAALTEDPGSRVAVETLLTTGLVVLAGEITTNAVLDFAAIARRVICEIGYDTGDFGFDGNAVGVITALDRQSPDIARGVTESHDMRTRQHRSVRLGRRGRPGHDVRLRDQRDARAHADADRAGAQAGPAARARCAATGCCRTCGPTARPR